MKEALDCFQRGKSFLTISHVQPDGDALASQLAIGLGLEQLGKKVVYFNDGDIPESLKFLPKAKEVVSVLPDQPQFDVVISCDCGSLARLGDKFLKYKNYKTLVNVDHHFSNDRYGNINVVMPEAASTGEVVWGLLEKLNVTLTKDIATNIYCTLVTDTGSFRYSNTKTHTLQLAARMLEAGTNPEEVSEHLFESQPYEAFLLLSRVLNRMELSKDKKYSWSVIYQKDLKETGTKYEVTEEFINYPRSIRGVWVAVLFKELQDGHYKVSLRSKTDAIDVSSICQKFQGGGHKRASACILKGKFEEVKTKLFHEIEEALSKQERQRG
ncbi:MAG: bifunctional oligoribonuclease/PAP phosphatase NrnA [Deltaproteobacteria bacterium]|nr:bifunctional oligoribonuclease/PAP phosphatase NrnA [Deltaproteobacteria bacterium]